jgi:hypothetical protein
MTCPILELGRREIAMPFEDNAARRCTHRLQRAMA